MTLRALVFYIIPAFLLLFGVGLLLLTRLQRKYVVRPHPEQRIGLKDPAE